MSSPVPAAAVGSPRPGSSPVPPPPAESVAAPAELTNWFLNAKRSLSSVALCSRAHVLVDSARAAIQDASVISARCVFLRNSLADQLAIARQINRMMHASQDSFRGEFEVRLAVIFVGWIRGEEEEEGREDRREDICDERRGAERERRVQMNRVQWLMWADWAGLGATENTERA